MSANTSQELARLLERLQARWPKRKLNLPPNLAVAEQVMVYAQLLGAKDPYLAILYPEMLDRVLANKMPDWVLPTGVGLVDVEGLTS